MTPRSLCRVVLASVPGDDGGRRTTRSRAVRRTVLVLVATSLTGCALVAPAPPRAEAYQCDAGRTFTVTNGSTGETAIIEIAGMHFALQAEAANGPGRRHACGVLTLWRDEGRARVEMQGSGLYENCRSQPR